MNGDSPSVSPFDKLRTNGTGMTIMASKSHMDNKAAQGVVGDRVSVGAFTGSHGVRGDIKLRSFTADPDAIFAYGELYLGPVGRPVRIKRVGQTKGAFTVRMEGINNREEAQALNGQELFVPRSALGEGDEDEFLFADLIGLKAVSPAASALGIVRGVENFGADDILEVILDQPVKGLGRMALIPFTKALVPVVDVAGGTVTVDLDAWLDAQQMATPEGEKGDDG